MYTFLHCKFHVREMHITDQGLLYVSLLIPSLKSYLGAKPYSYAGQMTYTLQEYVNYLCFLTLYKYYVRGMHTTDQECVSPTYVNKPKFYVKEKVANIATALSTLDKCCEEVSHQEETIKANIDVAIQQLWQSTYIYN